MSYKIPLPPNLNIYIYIYTYIYNCTFGVFIWVTCPNVGKLSMLLINHTRTYTVLQIYYTNVLFCSIIKNKKLFSFGFWPYIIFVLPFFLTSVKNVSNSHTNVEIPQRFTQLTHLSVYITTKCNTQNVDVLKNSLLKLQNSMKTVFISFIIVIL